MRGLTIRIYLNPKLYIEKYTDLCMFFSERIDLYIKSMIDLINFQYSRDGMGRLSDISRPWSSTCEHKSTKTKRYGFMWVSATGQPSPSHLLTSWQCYPLGVESPSTWHVPVQWVAVGECIPYQLYQELLQPSRYCTLNIRHQSRISKSGILWYHLIRYDTTETFLMKSLQLSNLLCPEYPSFAAIE